MSSEKKVFVNCPFDTDYTRYLDVILFAVLDCGFRPMCALEIMDSGENRLDKIFRMIKESNLGIHDMSRVELDQKTQLPRFNMPFELGIYLGAKKFGNGNSKNKKCLVIDRIAHRYKIYLSDMSGQDFQSYGSSEKRLLTLIRDWLSQHTPKQTLIPSGPRMYKKYQKYKKLLPKMCEANHLDEDHLLYNEKRYIIQQFLENEDQLVTSQARRAKTVNR